MWIFMFIKHLKIEDLAHIQNTKQTHASNNSKNQISKLLNYNGLSPTI